MPLMLDDDGMMLRCRFGDGHRASSHGRPDTQHRRSERPPDALSLARAHVRPEDLLHIAPLRGVPSQSATTAAQRVRSTASACSLTSRTTSAAARTAPTKRADCPYRIGTPGVA